MDLLPNHNSPVLVDYISANMSRFGLSSALLLSSPRKKLILGNLDDVIATGWHDFINVSSSSTLKLNNDSGSDSAYEIDETENTYRKWMVRLFKPPKTHYHFLKCYLQECFF